MQKSHIICILEATVGKSEKLQMERLESVRKTYFYYFLLGVWAINHFADFLNDYFKVDLRLLLAAVLSKKTFFIFCCKIYLQMCICFRNGSLGFSYDWEYIFYFILIGLYFSYFLFQVCYLGFSLFLFFNFNGFY